MLKDKISPLHKARLEYQPLFPELLRDLEKARFVKIETPPKENLKGLFPNTYNASSFQLMSGKGERQELKIGVLFSGGQAAGGHNVIAGLFDCKARLIGFLDGPSGLIENEYKEIKNIDSYRNQGGFDLIGSGRTKIETADQLKASLQTVISHKLDGLVIIGGDDSNTNAAILAEYFLAHGSATRVVGVPKTIDGDLQSDEIEIPFGFDSACKTYSELIGNVARDVLSSKKYYHFIKLMGRSASHIALECAMATCPNLCLIGEEKMGLEKIISQIANLVERRFEAGKEYGIILVPEGLAEFVPHLAQEVKLEKDPHGNVLLSQIETEKLLIDLTQKELQKRQFKGKFNTQSHFFGYEGRACLPTNFDANYCYTLGKMAFLAVRDQLTGVICAVQRLSRSPHHWEMKAVSLVQLIHMEERLGAQKPVIKKTLVDLNGSFFVNFSRKRKDWEIEDHYRYPGPIQFFGPPNLTDSAPASLEKL